MNQQTTSRSAWLLLVFLTLLNILNFVDRQLIVNLAPQLIEELKLDLKQVALLYGYYFLVFYTLMGMVMATIADRWSRQRLIAGGLALWSLLTAASGAFARFGGSCGNTLPITLAAGATCTLDYTFAPAATDTSLAFSQGTIAANDFQRDLLLDWQRRFAATPPSGSPAPIT